MAVSSLQRNVLRGCLGVSCVALIGIAILGGRGSAGTEASSSSPVSGESTAGSNGSSDGVAVRPTMPPTTAAEGRGPQDAGAASAGVETVDAAVNSAPSTKSPKLSAEELDQVRSALAKDPVFGGDLQSGAATVGGIIPWVGADGTTNLGGSATLTFAKPVDLPSDSATFAYMPHEDGASQETWQVAYGDDGYPQTQPIDKSRAEGVTALRICISFDGKHVLLSPLALTTR